MKCKEVRILSVEQSIRNSFMIKTELEALTYFSMDLRFPYLNSVSEHLLNSSQQLMEDNIILPEKTENLLGKNYYYTLLFQVCYIALTNPSPSSQVHFCPRSAVQFKVF